MPFRNLGPVYRMSIQRLILPLAMLLSLSFAAPGQETLREKVQAAINLPFPSEATNTRSQLTKLGPSAAPYVVELINSRNDLHPIRKTFLIDVVATMRGAEIEKSLFTLLSDKDPYVRGLTTTYLTKRKVKSSIPFLIKLLDDQAIYKTINQTDPATSRDVLVRDVAIDALEATTQMKLAPKGSKSRQAQAWLRWWRLQQSSKLQR